MAENIMIQNGGSGFGKPMGSLKFDDFLKNLPIKFLDLCKVPQLLRRIKESQIQLNLKCSIRQC